MWCILTESIHTKHLERGLICFTIPLYLDKQLENAGEAQKETKVPFHMPRLILRMSLCICILPGSCRNRVCCVVAQAVHCTAPLREMRVPWLPLEVCQGNTCATGITSSITALSHFLAGVLSHPIFHKTRVRFCPQNLLWHD